MNTAASNTSSSASQVDLKEITDRAKRIIADPVGGWTAVKEYQYDLKSLIINYAAIVSAVPAITSFVHSWLIGYGFGSYSIHLPFGSALQLAVVTYLQSLIMLVVGGFVLQAVMPKVGGSTTNVQGSKLIAFAGTAASVASIGNIIPYLGWLIMLAGAVYSIYTYWNGFPVMCQVAPEKRVSAFAISTVAMIIAGIVVGLVLHIVSPRMEPAMPKIEINGQDLSNTLQQLQRNLQANHP